MTDTNVESVEPTSEVAKVDVQRGVRGRIKDSFALVQSRVSAVEARARAQWVEIPNQLRDAVDTIAERVRATLDLPSRAELEQLINRVEELDRQLAALQSGRPVEVPESAKKVAKPKKPAKKTTAQKTARKPSNKSGSKKKKSANGAAERKTKIKKAAAKRKRS